VDYSCKSFILNSQKLINDRNGEYKINIDRGFEYYLEETIELTAAVS